MWAVACPCMHTLRCLILENYQELACILGIYMSEDLLVSLDSKQYNPYSGLTSNDQLHTLEGYCQFQHFKLNNRKPAQLSSARH